MDFLTGIDTISFGIGSIAGVFKLLFLVIIFGYIIYVFLLTLRVRILSDTVKTSSNGTTKMLSYVHLVVALVGSALSIILILLG